MSIGQWAAAMILSCAICYATYGIFDLWTNRWRGPRRARQQPTQVTDLAGRTAGQAAAEGLPHIKMPRQEP